MTSIGFINGVTGATPTGSARLDARQAALGAIGEVGQRVLSWIAAVGGDKGGAATESWAAGTGNGSGNGAGFTPNLAELARGGDVYGLRDIASGLAAQFGATPAQEGDLNRALESFTRQAVVQLAGLSGASPDRQLSGLREAFASGGEANVGTADGVDGIVERLDTATALLTRQNGA